MKKKIVIALIAVIPWIGCNKSDFLNEKPNKALVILKTLDHLQALLDMSSWMNGVDGQGVTPQLGESGIDNSYLIDADFNTFLRPQMQNYYIWAEQPYDGVQVLDWEYPYRAILAANTVLEKLKEIKFGDDEIERAQNIEGQALFHRAHLFYQLAQVFAPPYIKGGENKDLSIPLRNSSDINEPLSRSTVKETYESVINSLNRAIPILDEQKVNKHRASRQAAYALLSRVYLSMRYYEEAKLYADSCLMIQNDLYNYNLIDSTPTYPFRNIGDLPHPIVIETIFKCLMLSSSSQRYPTTYTYALVDTTLYNSYSPDDLRKSIFFHPKPTGYRFKGSYHQTAAGYFSGLAVDEILLNRAEASVRLGNVEEGLRDINSLLLMRWKSDTYIPYEKLNADEALNLILEERRKQLVYRGLRWTDIRRLNQEGYNISIKRKLNNQDYILLPDDPRWVWPFPLEVLAK